MENIILLWKKLKDNAIIPSKDEENIGYDIYAAESDSFWLLPHETKMISTGLAVAIIDADKNEASNDYALIAKDRGSTGSIGLHTHCGVIDAGYRGEIFIALCNTGDYPILFTNDIKKVVKEYDDFGAIDYICYPLSKAITQVIVSKSYNFKSIEADDETWAAFSSTKRGDGKLGSSQK